MTRRPSVSTSGLRWRLTRASMTSCGKSSPGPPDAKRLGFKAGDFSYNTGKLRCPVCDGTGVIDLDVQFLPDVTISCPECRGSRYGRDAGRVRHGEYSLLELMAMDVNTALETCRDLKTVRQRLQVLQDLGLGISDVGGGDSQPLWRRGPAAEAGQ